MLGCLVAPATQASLLLTEIHYNGPAPGSDPDEFLEFANSGTTPIALAGYHLTDAIDFSFAEDDVLGAGASLVLARDLAGFSAAFPTYDGALYGFSGALSNSGETLTLTLDGTAVWSISYDDGGSWPREADGGGASLQLLPGAVDYNDPASWTAAAPDPGSWAGLTGTPGRRPVPAPATLWLIAGALPLVLRRVRRHRR